MRVADSTVVFAPLFLLLLRHQRCHPFDRSVTSTLGGSFASFGRLGQYLINHQEHSHCPSSNLVADQNRFVLLDHLVEERTIRQEEVVELLFAFERF